MTPGAGKVDPYPPATGTEGTEHGARAAKGGPLLDVAGAAARLAVTEAFVRRLVLERRIRYFKLGKFVRFRACDLDAFVDEGCRDPIEAPWPFRTNTPDRRRRRPGEGAGNP